MEKCEEHSEIKENILMQNVLEYKLYDSVCSTCLSELQRFNDDNVRSKLYSAVIKDKKDKIKQIKSNQVNFETVEKSCLVSDYLESNLFNLADELYAYSENFRTEVIELISQRGLNLEDIAKLKVFIGQILNENDEPKLKEIGRNEDLKIKYIKLAIFLLKFGGFESTTVSYKGLTENLKRKINEILLLRNRANLELTQWVRFLLEEFYGFAYKLEGLEIDEEFRRNLKIDFVDESSLLKIRQEYEMIIRLRDERYLKLQIEFDEMRRKMKEQEEALTQLRNERERNLLEIERYRIEISGYRNDLENYKNQISQLNILIKEKEEVVESSSGENENYLRIIESLEEKVKEYENRISIITIENNTYIRERETLQISLKELSSKPPVIEYVERERLLTEVIEVIK